jgi:hypothetical protein
MGMGLFKSYTGRSSTTKGCPVLTNLLIKKMELKWKREAINRKSPKVLDHGG